MKKEPLEKEEVLDVLSPEIKEWEKKYGYIKKIVLPAVIRNEEEVHPEVSFYLREPDRATLKYAQTKQIKADSSIDPVSPGEVILKKCYLGGDDVMTKNCYFFRACIEATAYMNEELGF